MTTPRTSLPPATSLAPPLWPTAAFASEEPAHAARRAARKRVTDFYTRFGNPTVQAFADAVAELEGAEAALASSSGMGAISTCVLGLCSSGDHIVTQRQLFSATALLFEHVCPRFGIEVTWVDVTDSDGWAAAVRPGRTKLVFCETPSNPTLELADLARLGSLDGVITVVDATLATPLAQQPLQFGIDLVVHSATKALAGHNDATLGVVAGEKMLIDELWQYAVIQGSCASPYDSWNGLRGLKTFDVRFERQSRTAAAVAAHLSRHPGIERVFHPFAASSPQRELACRQMTSGGTLVSFELFGGMAAAEAFLDRLSVPLLAPSLGGPESLVTHPASTTHAALSAEQRREAGVSDGLIRLSVGLEPTEALVADLQQALDAEPRVAVTPG